MTGEDRAWGWVRHLRDGGTTPWGEWTGTAAAPPGHVHPAVPGAQSLELVRRLNGVGTPSPQLVDRVLGTSAPGRGQPDLEIAGVAVPSDFGPRPVDPSDLPERELLRVAAAVIAEDVVAAGLPEPVRPRPSLPWRRHYRVVGDPELADPMREELVARGRKPGGRDAQVFVMAAPVDVMLADLWTRCCFELAPPHWVSWVEKVIRHDELPPRIDVLATAQRWADQVGRDRVTIVLDPTAVSGHLGLRRPLVVPTAPPAVVPDLARRVAALLGLHVTNREKVRLMSQTLRPWIEEVVGDDGPRPAVPARLLPWVGERAEQIKARVRRAGYPVAGDLDDLAPGRRTGAEATDPGATLEVAMRLMMREDDR